MILKILVKQNIAHKICITTKLEHNKIEVCNWKGSHVWFRDECVCVRACVSIHAYV